MDIDVLGAPVAFEASAASHPAVIKNPACELKCHLAATEIPTARSVCNRRMNEINSSEIGKSSTVEMSFLNQGRVVGTLTNTMVCRIKFHGC